MLAGFRPRKARFLRSAQDRLSCLGKRTQNQGHPFVAVRVPLPRSRRIGLRNLLRSDCRPPYRVRQTRGAVHALIRGP